MPLGAINSAEELDGGLAARPTRLGAQFAGASVQANGDTSRARPKSPPVKERVRSANTVGTFCGGGFLSVIKDYRLTIRLSPLKANATHL